MPDYKKMYFQLAAKVADALELLEAAQCQGEDSYIEDDEALRDAEGGVPYDPPRRFAPRQIIIASATGRKDRQHDSQSVR